MCCHVLSAGVKKIETQKQVTVKTKYDSTSLLYLFLLLMRNGKANNNGKKKI
jgi:hypothetical protein